MLAIMSGLTQTSIIDLFFLKRKCVYCASWHIWRILCNNNLGFEKKLCWWCYIRIINHEVAIDLKSLTNSKLSSSFNLLLLFQCPSEKGLYVIQVVWLNFHLLQIFTCQSRKSMSPLLHLYFLLFTVKSVI